MASCFWLSPTDGGAHEDWSRLARLSFDGPEEEMECSEHAIELLDLIEEVPPHILTRKATQ